jgi:drug/metabolite transporter (DMT)-like permease
VVFNVAAGLMFFNEKITLKVTLGIVITLTGIISVSLLKGGEAVKVKDSQKTITEDASYHKTISILLALMVGMGNAT